MCVWGFQKATVLPRGGGMTRLSSADAISPTDPVERRLDVRVSGAVAFAAAATAGWRVDMEDAHCCYSPVPPPADEQSHELEKELPPRPSLFAVFDGHGGSLCANLAADRLLEHVRATDAWRELERLRAQRNADADDPARLGAALRDALLSSPANTAPLVGEKKKNFACFILFFGPTNAPPRECPQQQQQQQQQQRWTSRARREFCFITWSLRLDATLAAHPRLVMVPQRGRNPRPVAEDSSGCTVQNTHTTRDDPNSKAHQSCALKGPVRARARQRDTLLLGTLLKSGSTLCASLAHTRKALVALVSARHVVLANLGDSMAAAVWGPGGGAVAAERWRGSMLTEEHKPSDAAERLRVEAAGGTVEDEGGTARISMPGARHSRAAHPSLSKGHQHTFADATFRFFSQPLLLEESANTRLAVYKKCYSPLCASHMLSNT